MRADLYFVGLGVLVLVAIGLWRLRRSVLRALPPVPPLPGPHDQGGTHAR